MLAALRPLGLKGTLDWPDLVEAAVFVQASIAKKSARSGAGQSDASPPERGRALLTYLDTHESRLFDLKKESAGIFQRVSQFFSDSAAEQRGKERKAAIKRLMKLSWVSPRANDYLEIINHGCYRGSLPGSSPLTC